jgi:ribonuclease M5
MKYRVNEIIIVEGRYDKNAVSQVVEGTVIETEGFGIFKDKDKAKWVRELALKRGAVILTDGDGAGFVIRGHLKSILNGVDVKNAYIPDVYGKEKRKSSPSKEGKLGVEAMKPDAIIEALRRSGVSLTENDGAPDREEVTKTDFYELGLSGKPNSSELRERLIKRLDLPERLTVSGLLQTVNVLFGRAEFYELMSSITRESSPPTNKMA